MTHPVVGAVLGTPAPPSYTGDEAPHRHPFRASSMTPSMYADARDPCCRRHVPAGHYTLDAETFAQDWQADYLKVDYCGSSVSREPAPQYAGFAALRDALNATGRPIYYSICPHTTAPATGTGKPYNNASVYSPPASWSREARHALANSILVEYTNTFDLWYADPTPAGDGGPMKIPGGIITNIDSVVQMTDLSYSTAGSWNDADMLQMCTYGEGKLPTKSAARLARAWVSPTPSAPLNG